MSSSPDPFQSYFDSHEPKKELDSPFLNEALFVDEETEAASAWETRLNQFQLESPFLRAFEEGWGAIGEAEEIEDYDEFVDELGEEDFEEEAGWSEIDDFLEDDIEAQSDEMLWESEDNIEDFYNIEFEAPPLLKNPTKSDPTGQTLYVQISLGKDKHCIQRNDKKECVEYKTFTIGPMTGIFIPENYVPQAEIDLILYLHGHKSNIPGSDALIAEYWDGKKYSVFALREEINASKKNVILVAPTLGLKSEAGDLVRRNGLDNYLDKVLEALKTYGPYQGQPGCLGKLIIAAHSGGGKTMQRLALSSNSYAAKIAECWGFDSQYQDASPWIGWAQRIPQSGYYSYYYDGGPTANSKNLLEQNKKTRLQNIHPIESTIKDHFKLVRYYLQERLQGAGFLKDTVQANQELSGYFSRWRNHPEAGHNEWENDYELANEAEEFGLYEYEAENPNLPAKSLEEYDIPNLTDLSLMHDDLSTLVREDEIIGFETGSNLNIQISVPNDGSTPLERIPIKATVWSPGKPSETIVTQTLNVPKAGMDSSTILYKLSVPVSNVGKMLSSVDDEVKEVATVRRIGGTSDKKFITALGSSWQGRGQAEQSNKCGTDSSSLSSERPDALKLLQSGGCAILEIEIPSISVKVKRFIRNPADVFYYSGHGIGFGYCNRNKLSPMNYLGIEDQVLPYYYCPWAKPSDLINHWKNPMDLDVFIIASCSVLAVDASTGSVKGDGLEWAKLLQPNGPLIALLGYGDRDANEKWRDKANVVQIGPLGSTAPLDSQAGDAIAEEMGKWLKDHPSFKGIIKKWLSINFSHLNPFAVGMDKDGYCWRTRRTPTSGVWTIEKKLVTRDKRGNKISAVIEKTKI
jgi:hypothetical protein